MPSREGSETGSLRDVVAWLAIGVLAVAFRLHDIDARDVWIDEANGILTAARAVPDLIEHLRLDSSPPLYYVLLHYWMALFGDGPVAVRGLSVVFALLLVAATGWAGGALLSPAAGRWAAFFVAVSPTQAYYAQQARMYTLLPLLALLSVAFLVRHLRDGRRLDQGLWIGATVLALYTHNFALYLLPVQALLVALSGQLRRGLARWGVSGALVALAFAPWLPIFLEQLGNRDHYAWFLADWERWGPLGAFLRTWRSFSPGAEYLLGGLGKYALWKGWPTAGAVALAGLGAWTLASRRREEGAVAAFWPVCFLLVPIVLSLATSLLLTPNYVPGRVDQALFPAFALLVGAGLARLGPRLRGAVALAILLVAGWTHWILYPGTPVVGRYQQRGVRHEVPIDGTDRALAERIAARWRAGDVVVTTSLSRASLAYYLGRLGVDARFVSYPRESADHLGSQNDARLLADPRALVAEAAAVLEEARALAAPDGRVFLVRVRARVNGPLEDASVQRQGFERIEVLGNFSQVGTSETSEVLLYRPRADAPAG